MDSNRDTSVIFLIVVILLVAGVSTPFTLRAASSNYILSWVLASSLCLLGGLRRESPKFIIRTSELAVFVFVATLFF